MKNCTFNYTRLLGRVLQHHKLTEHGDGVIEADLIDAMLTVMSSEMKEAGKLEISVDELTLCRRHFRLLQFRLSNIKGESNEEVVCAC